MKNDCPIFSLQRVLREFKLLNNLTECPESFCELSGNSQLIFRVLSLCRFTFLPHTPFPAPLRCRSDPSGGRGVEVHKWLDRREPWGNKPQKHPQGNVSTLTTVVTGDH